MDVIAVVLVPVSGLLIVAGATVRIVASALKDTASQDRAPVLSAVADVIRAMRGRGTHHR